MRIGNKIKKIREFRNLTQEHLASKLGISQSNYARIEKEEVKINDERLSQIAEILEVTKENITNLDDNIFFNITNSENFAAGQNCTVNNYQISPEIQKLYEDKIKLLEEIISIQKKELKILKVNSTTE
jgi:transcriptional regulator with XRE-family HTH domain